MTALGTLGKRPVQAVAERGHFHDRLTLRPGSGWPADTQRKLMRAARLRDQIERRLRRLPL